ncbi:MAG TPA: DNA translocase FtsK 4TM domain-containing protein [Sandaracinaceae bacterium LLY-WYZ-13_1]|nr:DNA translocase FtsK 4TM domain-containing protein [Sandaracinaceae bacterium LLY-WYZ-13_1]
MGAPHTTSAEGSSGELGRRHEVLGIVCASATVLVTLSLWSYDAHGGRNWIGPVGAGLAGVLATAFGVAAWLVPVELGLATVRLFQRRAMPIGVGRVASTMVIVLVGCAMVHLAMADQTVFGDHLPGGVLGEVLGEVLRSLLGLAGSFVVGAAVLLITVVLRTPFSVIQSARAVADKGASGARRARDWAQAAWDAWREAREIERLEREEAEREAAPKIVERTLDGTDPGEEPVVFAETDGEALADPEDAELVDEPADAEDEEAAPPPLPAEEPEAKPAKRAKRKQAQGPAGPTIVAPREAAPKPRSVRMPAPECGDFELPPMDVFDAPPAQAIHIDEKTLREHARQLTEKLEAYRVKGRVDEIHPGPVVTMYEFEPESGTKISKIAGLTDDLAMALAAKKVRIVAPIPGKARVGFELPNKDRQTVYLREVLEDDRWQNLKANLPVAFGKDIAGQPVYGDLSKMPHLLVAGATGSGKSVGLNVMLCSLLQRRTPEEVRLLMIDPKVVELAVFDGIPHMLLPVVTDMKKASLALRWAVDEMERRYQLFADAGARNINTYNQRVDKVRRGEMPAEKLFRNRKGKVRATGAKGEDVMLDPVDGESPDPMPEPERLPYVVVVVDEFADLMMVAAKDVEAAIARLAQKARAAGIHVILATQRPSVDVITGMIKANFPSRIAFKVSQRQDSSTILGRNGAEHLLGMGDMLMLPPGSSDLKRVHSAYVSEDEVKGLCDHLREQGQPVYDEKILEPRDDDAGGPAAKSDDPTYDKAVACVAQAGYCSISHIQRQLSVGYNKAAKLVDRMEAEGVVGPASSKAGGRREVLIQAL